MHLASHWLVLRRAFPIAADRPAFERSAETDFREAFQGAGDLSLRFVADANHRLMYDQPAEFSKLLLEELDRVDARSRRPLSEAPPAGRR